MAAHIRVIGVDVRNCYVRSIAELSSGRIRVIGVDVCFRYPALVRRGAIFICADTVVAGFAIGGPVAVGVLVDWRCARNRKYCRSQPRYRCRLSRRAQPCP